MGGSPSGATDWDLPGNWQGGVPSSISYAIIPGGVANYPVLPDAARTVKTINILNGGVVHATTGTPTLSIAGASNAWHNIGTFNAGAGTVIFTNAAATMSDPTYFNNLTVADGAGLTPETGNYWALPERCLFWVQVF